MQRLSYANFLRRQYPSVMATGLAVGGAAVERHIQPWKQTSRNNLPAGRIPPILSELVGVAIASALLLRLFEPYERVVLDSPPLPSIKNFEIACKKQMQETHRVGADHLQRLYIGDPAHPLSVPRCSDAAREAPVFRFAGYPLLLLSERAAKVVHKLKVRLSICASNRSVKETALIRDVSKRLGYVEPPPASFRFGKQLYERMYDGRAHETLVGTLAYSLGEAVRAPRESSCSSPEGEAA